MKVILKDGLIRKERVNRLCKQERVKKRKEKTPVVKV